MSAVKEALGQWYEKQQREKKGVIDEREVDLVVCDRDTGMVESILVWRKVSVDRARRLQEREQKGFDDEVCIVLTGRGVIGRIINKDDLIA